MPTSAVNIFFGYFATAVIYSVTYREVIMGEDLFLPALKQSVKIPGGIAEEINVTPSIKYKKYRCRTPKIRS